MHGSVYVCKNQRVLNTTFLAAKIVVVTNVRSFMDPQKGLIDKPKTTLHHFSHPRTISELTFLYPQNIVTMSFSFGFSGDDIEEDPNDAQTSNPELATPAHAGNAESNASNPPLVEATVLDVDELVGVFDVQRLLLFSSHTREFFYFIFKIKFSFSIPLPISPTKPSNNSRNSYQPSPQNSLTKPSPSRLPQE